MGSHSVTCHPAEVTFPPLPQPKLVLDLATPEGCKADLTNIVVSVTFQHILFVLSPVPETETHMTPVPGRRLLAATRTKAKLPSVL